MSYYSRIITIVVIIISIIIPTTYAQDSTDRAIIAEHPLISTRVKNIVDSQDKLWNKRSITFVQNNISLLQRDLNEKYEWEMIITENPQTEQESLSQAMDVLARYLCLHRQAVLQNYSEKNYYKTISHNDMEITQGVCYRNTTLLNQEWIRYYTIPEVGTLQTIPLSLLKDLGYSTTNIEHYMQSDDIELTSSSDQFFFEWSSNKEIIPLLNLTPQEKNNPWNRKFDQLKIVAYTETINYPFVDGNIMIAIFAKKGDHLIKITTPYGKLYHEMLSTVMNMTQELFVHSIHENLRDSILLSQYYDLSYDKVLQDQGLIQDRVTKNLVHYYLSQLRQYDEQPQEFVKMIPWLINKDMLFYLKLQSTLEDLEAFL